MGMREEEWPATADRVAALLARWDQHEPLETTPEEEARWKEVQRRQKEFEKATFAEEAERLRKQWARAASEP